MQDTFMQKGVSSCIFCITQVIRLIDCTKSYYIYLYYLLFSCQKRVALYKIACCMHYTWWL